METKKSALLISFSPALDSVVILNEPLRAGGVHRVIKEKITFGGKAINMAKVLRANRIAVTVAGIIGEDYCEAFYSYLKGEGISARFFSVPYPTRKNIMIKDSAGREFKINYPAFPSLKLPFQKIKKFVEEIAAKHSVVILSGSLPDGMPPETYALLIEMLKRDNKFVVLDTSGTPFKIAVNKAPNIIKPNMEEFSEICSLPLSGRKALIGAIRRFSSAIEVVIVSAGKAGAFFGHKNMVWHAIPPAIEPKDTTGSGDYLLGQFCAGFFNDGRVLNEKTMAMAVAAGTACAEVEATPFIKKSRILELARHVVVKRIS
jgi:1-phosphofructokinase